MTRQLDDILDRGLGDWVSLAEVVDVVRTRGSVEPADLAAAAIAVVSEALDGSLVRLGSITADGFEPWISERTESLERVRQLLESGRVSQADGVYDCWLANTPLGNEHARAAGFSE
jgi:hypothetical protein